MKNSFLFSKNLDFIPAVPKDLDWILAEENKPENRPFLSVYQTSHYLFAIENPDFQLYVIKEKISQQNAGFILLVGIQNPNHALEIRKILISKKGKGYGREVLQQMKKLCFEELSFHRLWLDVFDGNEKALQLYQSEGFQIEGRMRESIFHGGSYLSVTLLSILKDEFLALKNL